MAKRWNPLEVPEHAIIVYVRTPMELEDLADQMPHLASRNMARVFAALWRDAHRHRRIFPWVVTLHRDDRDGVKYLIGTYTPSNVKRNLGPVGGATPEDARMEDKKVATKKSKGMAEKLTRLLLAIRDIFGPAVMAEALQGMLDRIEQEEEEEDKSNGKEE